MTGEGQSMHLAQLNVAKARHALDDPRMADFMDNLDRVNAIAERSPGFVWRLQDEGGNATGIGFGDDPDVIVNMSVWVDVQAFENFVWNTLHKQFYARRTEWFGAMVSNHLVMWWVPADLPRIGRVFQLDDIVAALRYMEDNAAGGKIVVLTPTI